MTKFTYASQDDLGQALVDVLSLVRDLEEVSSDKRTAHVPRLEILVTAALHRKTLCKEGSLSAQLMDYVASPNGSKKKPKLTIVKA